MLNFDHLKGVQLCCGQAVDADLLHLTKTEVAQLSDFVRTWQDENQNAQVCSQRTTFILLFSDIVDNFVKLTSFLIK